MLKLIDSLKKKKRDNTGFIIICSVGSIIVSPRVTPEAYSVPSIIATVPARPGSVAMATGSLTSVCGILDLDVDQRGGITLVERCCSAADVRNLGSATQADGL